MLRFHSYTAHVYHKMLAILGQIKIILTVIISFRIGIDSNDNFTGWILERVELGLVDGNRLYFPCKHLFDSDEDSGKIEQELLPVNEGIVNLFHVFIISDMSTG